MQIRGLNGKIWEVQFAAFARALSIISPLLSALSSALIMYVLSRIMLKVWKIPVAPLGRFQNWEASEYLVWAFVLGGVVYHIEFTRVIGINILLGPDLALLFCKAVQSLRFF